MNILIYLNSHLWENHLRLMIELGLIHKNKKDKIFITFCEGIFLASPANYYNKKINKINLYTSNEENFCTYWWS